MLQKMHLVWLLLLSIAATLTTTAAPMATDPDWLMRPWQLDDGLPGNSVTGVVQTPDGYLWVATESGLARFDGDHFQNIRLPIPSGRTRPIIRAMCLGAENEIWLALEGSLVVSLSGKSTNLFTGANGIPRVRPDSIVQDEKRTIWVSYSDGGVCSIANGKVIHFGDAASQGVGSCYLEADVNHRIWFARSGVVGIIRDGTFQTLLTLNKRVIRLGRARAGGMWICAGLQILRSDENGTTVDCGTLPADHAGVDPTAVFEDRTGALWIGTSVNGLFRHDGTNWTRVEASHELILSLGEDNEGDVWAGTGGGGLNRLRPRVMELQANQSGLPSALLRSICEDPQGAMWAVGQNGGVARRTHGQWKTLGDGDGWKGTRATCVSSDGKSGVWIATEVGELWHWSGGQFSLLNTNDGLGGRVIRGLMTDHAGDLWIALEAPACLQRLHENRFQTFKQFTVGAIRALAEDTTGNVWCGTEDGLLYRVDGGKLKSETQHTLAQPKPIRCMTAMADGSLWIGYAGAGVGILHDGKFVRISEEQGLFDPYVCGMETDGDGGFWCATDRGIFEVRLSEIEAVIQGRADRVRSIRFGRDEGRPNLQGSFSYCPGATRSQDGVLWFPMRTGLAMINPQRTPTNSAPLTVLIESVTVDGHAPETDSRGRLVLPPGHRRLDMDFTAPTFVAPENVRFRYRIAGWDESWNESGTQRSATYSRLPAGDYKFCVIACNNLGIWNTKETTVALTVPPFIWERWPVRLAAFAIFLAAVTAGVRYVSFRRLRRRLVRLEQESALNRERSRIAQDLHDDIGASLTHIAMLSELAQKDFDKPPVAKDHIDQIFHQARSVIRSLDEIVWTVNPKNDTLDVFVAYLCTYAPDYLRSASVRCRLDVPLDVPAIPLPPGVGHHLYLALKETLHNIVKHAEATEVWLRLRLTPGLLTLIIEDNGCGFNCDGQQPPDANGLGNLNLRLSEIGGRCEQQSETEKGTTIRFTMPLKEART